jgi:hypothetical protein
MKKARRYFTLIILMAVPFLCCSCLPLYLPTNLGLQVDSSVVKPGTTTKEEVLLRFGGKFSTVGDNERLFITVFPDSHTFLIMSGFYVIFPVYAKEFKSFYEVQIEFDDNDVVKRCETFKLPREIPQEKSTP